MIRTLLHPIRYGLSRLREGRKETRRSSRWNEVRDGFLVRHPVCEACGCGLRLQVHHVMPFHLHPELELDESNLITLCMGPNECHLRIGHGGSWGAYNPRVRIHAERFASVPSDHPETREAILETCRVARLK